MVTQQAFPCSKSTIETLEKGRRHDVSIVAFEQVDVSWGCYTFSNHSEICFLRSSFIFILKTK